MITTSSGRKKRVIRSILSGGVGNQLFMIFAVLDLGFQTKCKVIAYSPRTTKGFQVHGSSIEAFHIPGLGEYDPEPFDYLVRHRLTSFAYRYLPAVSKPLMNLTRYYESPVIGYDKALGHLENGGTIKGYFQTYRHFKRFKAHNPLFEITLKNPSKEFLKLEQSLKSKEVSVIHVRLGDYLLHKDSVGVLSSDYFKSCLEIMSLKNSSVLVFSDDIEEATRMISHLLPKSAIWLGPASLSAEESLALMWRGNQFILSNSSFSYWGALLARNPITVISPSKWFKNENDPTDLIPEEWLRIDSKWIT